MVAYELGWRRRFGEVVSFDVTAFAHDYDDLLGAPPSAAPVLDPLPVPHIVLPFMFDNFERGRLHGLEVAANWNVTKRWRLTGSYIFSRLTGISGFTQIISQAPPEQTFSLSSLSDIGQRWELDANLRYNDSQTAVKVDSWWSLDLRLGWRPTQQLNLSLIAKELLDPEHFEYNDAVSTEATSIGRSVFLRADWQF